MADATRPQPRLTRERLDIDAGLPLELRDASAEEIRRGVQMLLDIEAIRQLKHAYFRCIDTANFDELATLFHDDVSVHFIGGTYEWKLQGKSEYVEAIRASFHRGAVGHHNGHHPEIRIQSSTEATGCWYLADKMWLLDQKFFTTGTALYYDRYLKVNGSWLIRETRYERLYEINRALDHNPPLASHYLATHGSDPA